MTRIVGGAFGGRTLRTPTGSVTRPTAEKIRAALGNALQATGSLEGAAVLDLYAGSGALGLELLSRGAASLVAVERDKAALETLRHNVSELKVSSVEVLAGDVAVVLRRLAARGTGSRFDVVVADPPYGLPDADLAEVLAALVPLATPGADVVVERGSRSAALVWPPPIQERRTKRYGDTLLCYGRLP
ncbi:16S rRNA (guanine(966)-N(2))-methyltransferase RsmD [Nakamurella sp. A5-74]|uniref:16S rRNA (Guanine(966)-N(2))-methyltransferase RsmD n=1 Tax=Nakamurella sp. A5-74 TaxID=3158264 RepID=A0AAU8DW11_9ACTN